MAITINARGTSVSSFQLGKGGSTLFSLASDPGGINNDIWIDKGTGNVKIKLSSAWVTFWHAGNDGAGSGLDADLLDAQQGSYYLSLTNATGTLAASNGGTGISSYTTGNYINAQSSTTLQQRTPSQVRTDISANAFTTSESAPSSPIEGDEWLKLSTGKKYVYVNDGDSSQWVELESISINGSAMQVYMQATDPAISENYLWIQTGLGDTGQGVTMWINN